MDADLFSPYVECWLFGEEFITQTYGFNKGKEHAHDSDNIEISTRLSNLGYGDGKIEEMKENIFKDIEIME